MATLNEVYVAPVSVEGQRVYDPVTHRWLLDGSVIKKLMPELSDDEISRKQQSYTNHVYRFLKHKVAGYNWRFVEWLISCTTQGMSLMLEALRAQLEADSESNYDSIANVSPIDPNNNVTIDPKLIKEVRICPEAQDILLDGYVSVGPFQYYFNKRFYLGVSLPQTAYADWAY